MNTQKFKIEISYHHKGELIRTVKEVSASSSVMAWRFGLTLIPVAGLSQVQVKVNPIK